MDRIETREEKGPDGAVRSVAWWITTKKARQADGTSVDIVDRERPVTAEFLQELIDKNRGSLVRLQAIKSQVDALP